MRSNEASFFSSGDLESIHSSDNNVKEDKFWN